MSKVRMQEALTEYEKLFSLPKLSRVILLTLIVLTAYIIVIHLQTMFNLILCTVCVVASLIIYQSLLRTTRESVLDIRRSLFLFDFVVSISIGLMMLSKLITRFHKGFSFAFLIASVGFPIAFLFLVVLTTSIISEVKAIITSVLTFLPPSLLVIMSKKNLTSKEALLFTFGVLMILASIYITTQLPLRTIERLTGLEGLSLVRAFVFAWVDHKYDFIEELFDKTSHVEDIPIGLLKLGSEEDDEALVVIVPNVHPGPFLDIGSSNLPYHLASQIRMLREIDTVILHGACSHGQNMPKKDYIRELAEDISNDINSIRLGEDIFEPIRIDKKHLSFFIQRAGNNFLIIVSKHNSAFDDIDYGIGLFARELLRIRNFDGLLVDAHNSIKDVTNAQLLTIRDNEALEIVDILRDIENLPWKKVDRFRYGFYRVNCDKIGIKDGLGPLGISCLVYEMGSRKYSWIIIDANNLGEGLRDEIRDYVLSLGFDDAEVLTTDTHIVNALGPESAYPLLSKEKAEEIKECVAQACKRAVERLKEGKLGFEIKEYSVRVLGDEVVNNLLKGAVVASFVFHKMLSYNLLFLLIILGIIGLLF